MTTLEKSAPSFEDFDANPLPPAHGTIPHLRPHENLHFAQKHTNMAMQYANAGEPDSAKYHHEHAKLYTADARKLAQSEPAKEMPLDELVEEHSKLVGDLKSGDPKKLKEQAKNQEKELGEYKKELAEKCEAKRVEMSPDGKITLDVGAEPLDKKPSLRSGVSKSLREYWDLLKSKVSADDAFISLTDDDKDKDKEEQPPQDPQGGDAEAQGAEQPPQDSGDSDGLSPEETQQLQQQPDPQGDQPVDDGQAQNTPDQQPSPEEIAQMMADAGHSQSEIAYIMHGHVPPGVTIDDHKMKNEALDGEMDRNHASREADAKHEHALKINELEQKKKSAELEAIDPQMTKEHAKRLKDLEYEKAKKSLEAEDHDGEKAHKMKLREIELEAKRRELELKSDDGEKRHKERMRELEYNKAHRETSEVDPTNQLKAEQAKFELEIEKMRVQFEMEMDKKERELELKYKEKELQLNLQLKAEAAKIKSQMQEEQMHADHEVNMQVKEHQSKHKIAESKKAPVKEKMSPKGDK